MALLGAGTCAVRTFHGAEPAQAHTSVASSSPAPTAAPRPGPHFAETLDVSTFLRGNIHTHTRYSDGDSPPADVYAYYRDHGYAFLAITDHNMRTDPGEFRAEQRPGFVMIPAEEITTLGGGKPVHVNALCSRSSIGGGTFRTTREALTWAVARVQEQGAIALVNHPNFDWTLTADDMPSARGAQLLEIWSGHQYVYSEGDLLRPSHEAIWTKTLDADLGFAGVAVDDMHNLLSVSKDPDARPMRGWVQVFGSEATEEFICDGLRRGRLYASSGAELSRIVVADRAMTLAVRAPSRVEFLGAEGALLAVMDAAPGSDARYEIRGGERYVRARITNAEGKRAWTQAYKVVR